jgi:hypothetical protein
MKFKLAILSFTLMLSACSSFNADKFVAMKNFDDMKFTYPASLDNPELDLANPAAVSTAVGVPLNGKANQPLYNIVMKSESTDAVLTRVIPVRVDNINDGAKIIRRIHKK